MPVVDHRTQPPDDGAVRGDALEAARHAGTAADPHAPDFVIPAPPVDRLDELAASFRTARPWPHLVLTDLLPTDVVAAAYAQELAGAHAAAEHANRRQSKAESSVPSGYAARTILDHLAGDEMVAFLRELTGISDLRADPTHFWAGLHVNRPGDFHALHHDFLRHPVDGSWHRVNVLVYLNPSWPDEYGGALELWRRGGRTPEAVVRPCSPNVVVFAPSMATVHGLPDPVACPPGQARLSLNAFYYSDHPPPGPPLEPLLRRPRRPQDPWRQGIATWPEVVNGIQQRTPVRLRRWRRRLLGSDES